MARPVGAIVKPDDLLAMEWVAKNFDGEPKTAAQKKYSQLAKDSIKDFEQVLEKKRAAHEKRKEAKAAKMAVKVLRDEGTELVAEHLEQEWGMIERVFASEGLGTKPPLASVPSAPSAT